MIKVELIETMGHDLTVVNSARVSFGKKKEVLDNGDIKLINYLGTNNHISPFGHCFASFHCVAPVFVARQLVKHKFLRWNEISRRYVNDPPSFFTPDEYRSAAPDKKQGSGSPLKDTKAVAAKVDGLHKGAARTYRRLLELGVCEEQARMVLPQSMMTEWYWSGSLDAFADMCNLRLKPDAQYETQLVAARIAEYLDCLLYTSPSPRDS